ncbi:MAG: hypothetical protein K0Q68_2886 [Moraxellaceae bacterium]|jgi:hypothetical protein|nr:hypothetical protein [Moraxellaceae bacterium]
MQEARIISTPPRSVNNARAGSDGNGKCTGGVTAKAGWPGAANPATSAGHAGAAGAFRPANRRVDRTVTACPRTGGACILPLET